MEYKDYYQILEISRTADDKELKKAFRKLARQYHPDLNPDDVQAQQRFQEVNEAYTVLSDPEKRKLYDQFGKDWEAYQRAGATGDFDWSRYQGAGGTGRRGQAGSRQRYTSPEDMENPFGGSENFSSFFDMFFGRGGFPGGGAYGAGTTGARGAVPGQDLTYNVEISLHEAYHGTRRVLQKDGHELEAIIPKGVKTGSKIRFMGEGYATSPNGSKGDLYLLITVKNHERFTREKDNLHVRFDLPMYTALLGGKVVVLTLNGSVELNIPEGTQNGTRFRLRGKGMPNLKNKDHYGDLYAEARIRLPERLSDAQKELLRQMQALQL